MFKSENDFIRFTEYCINETLTLLIGFIAVCILTIFIGLCFEYFVIMIILLSMLITSYIFGIGIRLYIKRGYL